MVILGGAHSKYFFAIEISQSLTFVPIRDLPLYRKTALKMYHGCRLHGHTNPSLTVEHRRNRAVNAIIDEKTGKVTDEWLIGEFHPEGVILRRLTSCAPSYYRRT